MPDKIFRERKWRSGYWYIELAPKHWSSKARYLIETAIGRTLSSREKVYYKDNNPDNCTIQNLIIKDFDKKIEWYISDGVIITTSAPLWSKKYSACKSCGTNNKRYGGLGLCSTCYGVDYRKPRN